jgi:hypothetical protein
MSMEDIPLILPPLENISREKIDIGSHAFDKISGDREINEEWIYHCLINEKKTGILKQRSNRFRIYYNHPTKSERYDLIIVVDIIESSKKDIRVVTTYEQSVDRRVR